MAKKEKIRVASAPLKQSPFAGLAGSLPGPPEVPAATSGSVGGTAPKAAAEEARDGSPAESPALRRPRGRLVQRRETKHRAGKAVIVVSGFEQLPDFDEAAIAALGKELKQALGCGGTLETRAGRLELVLQGDRPGQVAALLRARGFRVDGVTS